MLSTWEVKFAEWLDTQGIKWEYEKHLLKCGHLGHYYPDFYLPEKDQFIEIKGYPSENGMAKFNYWKERQPNRFFLYNKEKLQNLGVI